MMRSICLNGMNRYVTPPGLGVFGVLFFYNNSNPSGLFDMGKAKSIETKIQKGLSELKELM